MLLLSVDCLLTEDIILGIEVYTNIVLSLSDLTLSRFNWSLKSMMGYQASRIPTNFLQVIMHEAQVDIFF